MKESQSLKSFLGFTQEDMALVLNVKRSQYARYELGIRRIPLAAAQLLAEIVHYMCGPEVKTAGLAEQEAQKQKAIERMLKENEYQQHRITRKIESIEDKYTTNLKVLQLVEFLTLRAKSTESNQWDFLAHIGNKANKSLKTHSLATLFKLKLKLELLHREKELLEAENS